MNVMEKHGVKRVLNAIGTPTITGANVAAPEVIEAAAQALAMNVEIDELQRAASRAIAAATGAEAGCVTSSASSGIAIAVAASMTGSDLGRIVSLPDTAGLTDEVILQHGHDVNFGGRISQMARLSGARVVHIGTANHCDAFHLRSALGEKTAAVLFVVNGAVPANADFLALERAVELAAARRVPVIVDAAAEPDVRPFLRAGASLVIASGHKAMGAPTSGMICGRKKLIRACYLQNWGIGRAMKVGKEGIAGLIAALERWTALDREAELRRYATLSEILGETLQVRATPKPHRVAVHAPNARSVANALRENDPPVWVNGAEGAFLLLDLRVMSEDDARAIGAVIADHLANPRAPREDVPFHDLYWSEERLLAWPD
jgi:L-seryl-tRNA(Ser) seleniumtransferase